jgi:protein-disulfide isomerase
MQRPRKTQPPPQRNLFFAVLGIAVLLAAILFFALRPKPSALPATTDPAASARFVIGDAGAKVTVVEFMNYLCPHCADYAANILPLIKAQYVDTGKVRYVFRDFPFAGPTQIPVMRASEAAACAADQNQYLPFHEALLRGQTGWSSLRGDDLDRYLSDLGGQLGVAPASISDCLKAGGKKAGVEADLALAGILNVPGTPHFYINGKEATTFQSDWKKLLDEALAVQ